MTRTAEEWIARLRSAEVTASERTDFEAWLAADSSHVAAYVQCRDLESMTVDLRADPGLMGDLNARLQSLRNQAKPHSSRPKRTWFVPSSIAAAIALAAVALGSFFSTPQSTLAESVGTRHGEVRHIVLADGSSVALNTGSKVAWSFSPGERRMDLLQGEAYFAVARDASRPFIVRVGDSEIRVTGTEFSVRRDGEKVDVVVREGRVKFLPNTGPLSLIQTNVELTPGNRLSVSPGDRSVRVTAVDANRLTSWRTGSLEFDSRALHEVVAELNRYTDTPLVIGDPSIAGLRISGRVRVGDVDSVRFILRERFEIESVEQDGAIRLTRLPPS